MSAEDRKRWDARHAEQGSDALGAPGPPSLFAPFEKCFPTQGFALDLACGRGLHGLWLARRGMRVHGLDVSPVAVDLARQLAASHGLADHCRFDVVDLDAGLPASAPADVILCHLFRDARLDRAVIERLVPGGLLAIAVLSEVGATPGPFCARPGELRAAFGTLEILADGEGAGKAWALCRRG